MWLASAPMVETDSNRLPSLDSGRKHHSAGRLLHDWHEHVATPLGIN